MLSFDRAVDAYIAHIARTRPWTVPHEADQLHRFAAWLRVHTPHTPELAHLNPGLIERYRVAVDPPAAEYVACESALRKLCAWAEYQNLLATNCFVRATP